MNRALRGPAVFVIALIALGVVAGTVHPASRLKPRPTAEALPVSDSQLVCPDTTGESDGATTVTVANTSAQLPSAKTASVRRTTTLMSGSKAKTVTLPDRPVSRVATSDVGQALAITNTGAGAGAVAADQNRLIPRGLFRALLSAPCLAPGTDWWITGTDGRVGYSDRLVIANPGTTIANITVTAWSDKGGLEPPKLQSYSVVPGTANVLPVSQFAPNAGSVTLRVHANSGRIVSEVLDRRISGISPVGSDWIPPTQPPARDLVIPGYLGGRGARRLVITAPGTSDATVQLRLATTRGNFAPAGHQTVVVPADHTVELDIGSSLGGVPGAVVLHSDQDVVASGWSWAATTSAKDHPDLQWQPAALPVTRPAALPDNAPPFDSTLRLYVTAPEAGARLRVTPTSGAAKILSIPAGRTVAWDPGNAFGKDAYGPLVFTSAGGGPVYVSRSLFAYGAHGPLVTSEQPTPLPASVLLPAVEPDPRAGVP